MKPLSILIVSFLLIAPLGCSGQDSLATARKKEWLERQKAQAGQQDVAKDDTLVLPDLLLPEYTQDSTSNRRYYEALTQYFDYRIFGYQHRQQVFAWQLLSSKIIFFTVLFLVLIGTYFSYLQFRKAMLKDTAGADELKTAVEASPQGIKLSSPVLGVIILLISLLFFYLYLIYVYPIIETF